MKLTTHRRNARTYTHTVHTHTHTTGPTFAFSLGGHYNASYITYQILINPLQKIREILITQSHTKHS